MLVASEIKKKQKNLVSSIFKLKVAQLWAYYLNKLELKSNLSEILPVNCKFISFHIFIFALKVRFMDLKFEFCQFKLE